MPKSNRRIVLLGLFGTGNLGNEGSLAAMLRFLRSQLPEAEFSCLCSGPSQVEAEHRIPASPIWCNSTGYWHRSRGSSVRRTIQFFLGVPRAFLKWRRMFRRLRGVDAIIIPGTGILGDFGNRPFELPWDLFLWGSVAKLRRTKVLYVCVGAGPIHHPLSRWFMKQAARMADFRSFRDEISRSYLAGLGLDVRRDPVCVDLAFSLPVPAAAGRNPSDRRFPTVAVGVMDYYGWSNDPSQGAAIHRAYIDKLARFVRWLLDRQSSVQLLIGEKNDERSVADLIESVAGQAEDSVKARIIAEPIFSLGDVMSQAATADIVVTTRFHNVVCSLMVERPVVSLGYAEKNDVLLRDMGLAEYCQHAESFEVPRLISQVEELTQNWADARDRIAVKCREYRERLGSHLADVRARIG